MYRISNKKPLHGAPWLSIKNPEILNRFLDRFAIKVDFGIDDIVKSVADAFKHVPYENLTKILKASSVISTHSAMRYPDELLGDFLTWATGGTCFSLTAAIVAVYDALGIVAHPVLASRHYGVDTHCGLILVLPTGKILFLDPGYLLCQAVEVSFEHPVFIDTGFNTIELFPKDGNQMELYTIVKNNRRLRLSFKMDAVSDEMFYNAWERSFAFEMMTYPLVTRHLNGCHYYLQGCELAVRDSQKVVRTTLTPEKQVAYISGLVGINKEIALKALEKVNFGTHARTIAG